MTDSFINNGSLELSRAFSEYAGVTALEWRGEAVTYDQLWSRVLGAAQALKDLGAGRGDLIALQSPNSPLHYYLMTAAWVLGAVFIPADPKSPPGSLPAGVKPDFVFSHAPDKWPCARSFSLKAIKTDQPGSQKSPVNIDLEQEAGIVFTSGSTGGPKGVVHTTGGFAYSALGAIDLLDMTTEDRWLVSLPLFHVGGLLILVRTLLSGAAAIMHDAPGRLEDVLAQSRPSIMSMVPTQLARLLHSKKAADMLASMKAVLLGGAPSPRPLIDKALDAKIPIVPSYGSTETCALAAAVRPGSPRGDYYTAGKPLKHRTFELDEDGVILVGGRTLFKHYIADGQIIPRKGDLFRTSDLGKINQNGALKILGRRDQVFISGGENINPFEVEKAIFDTGLASTAFVVPVPDEDFLNAAWAFVESDAPHPEALIQAVLRKTLPPYKIPKRIILLTPEDKGSGIKYSRKALEEKAWSMAKKQ